MPATLALEDIEQKIATARANAQSYRQAISELETGLAEMQNQLYAARTQYQKCQAVVDEFERLKLEVTSSQSTLQRNKLIYSGFYQGMPGWCTVNRDIMRELHRRGVDIQLDPYFTEFTPDQKLTQFEESFFHTLINKRNSPQSIYFNSACTHLLKPNYPANYKIAFTMFESHEGLPVTYREIANSYNSIFVPSKHCKKLYEDAGIVRPIEITPIGVDIEKFRRVPPMPELESDRCVYGTSGWMCHRKGFDIVLKAYFTAFDADDNVELIFKPYLPWGGGEELVSALIADVSKHFTKRLPKLTVISRILTQEEMPAFYSSLDYYVVGSRGEGYAMQPLEALSCGVPVIHPSALELEYVTSTNSVPYYIEGTKVAGDEMCGLTEAYRGLEFIEPSWESLADRMRWTYENRLDYSESCRNSAELFSWDIMGEKMADHLFRIYTLFAREEL